MLKKQMLIQKCALYGSVLLASLMIVFALGFSTNFHSLRQHKNQAEPMFYVTGTEFYDEVQPYNRELFVQVIILFVIGITMFVTLTHRRRLYYISNYVTSLAFAGYASYLAVTVIVKALEFRALYLMIDSERITTVRRMLRMSFTESTFMMDAGIALCILLILLSALLVINLVLKTIAMKREVWLDEAAEVQKSV